MNLTGRLHRESSQSDGSHRGLAATGRGTGTDQAGPALAEPGLSRPGRTGPRRIVQHGLAWVGSLRSELIEQAESQWSGQEPGQARQARPGQAGSGRPARPDPDQAGPGRAAGQQGGLVTCSRKASDFF